MPLCGPPRPRWQTRRSSKSAGRDAGQTRRISRSVSASWPADAGLRHGGSGALGLVDVAIGRLDGYAELHINLWDVAAALAILRKSGAKVSDFMGADGGAGGNAIFACAPGMAEVWSDLPGLPPAL